MEKEKQEGKVNVKEEKKKWENFARVMHCDAGVARSCCCYAVDIVEIIRLDELESRSDFRETVLYTVIKPAAENTR